MIIQSIKKYYLSKCFFLLFLLNGLIGLNKAIANMPVSPCDSICATHVAMSNGNHCVVLNKKINMFYKSLGKNAPTMIFASGTGFPAIGWFNSNIATEMSNKVKVFAYDRIFTNNSCNNRNYFMPVTAHDVVNNLRELLKHEHIKPPYILVGQSFGGLYMQLFAREYPKEVAGLVLMDSVTSDGPLKLTKEEENFVVRHHLDHPQKPSPTNPLYNEIIGQLPSYLQLKNAPPLPNDMPLIVMYATKECLPKIESEKQLCLDKERMDEHFKQQVNLYNSSRVHKLIRVDGEHMSFFDSDKHSLVIKALNSILEMSSPKIKHVN